MTNDVAAELVKAELLRALNTWASYADITWTETTTANAYRSVDFNWVEDTDIGYAGWFDGPGGTLARGWYPPIGTSGETAAGDVRFDDEDRWEIGDPGSGVDIYSVALHELGHSLGLGHSTLSSAVMYNSISEGTVYSGLSSDDIAGIQAIYAAAPAGSVTKWESVVAHGAAGDIALAMADGDVEPRVAGLRTLRLTFNRTIDAATIDSPLEIVGDTGGAISTVGATVTLDGSHSVMTVVLPSALSDGDRYTITLSSSVHLADGLALAENQHVTIGALVGDVDGSGDVSSADALAIRSCGGEAADAETARCDVDCSGMISGQDMRAAVRRVGRTLQ
jgi:hypothetical protein